MIRGENSEPLPFDLIVEILSRLTAKSVARFRCVSKLWGSMLHRPYFKELFLTRSSARPPRLWFAVQRSDDWRFFTSPQPHDKSSSSLVVAAEFHTRFFICKEFRWLDFRGHASGLLFFTQSTRISEEDNRTVICNPSTGQFASLPLPKGRRRTREWSLFLGFDPIDKLFKVLSIRVYNPGLKEEPDQIMTLVTGKDSLRTIHCPLVHIPIGEGICIDGVLYYLATQTDLPSLIVCFDVRLEEFKFIHRVFISGRGNTKLINYKGKLGVITMAYGRSDYTGKIPSLKLCLWLIKDVEKPVPEWLKHFSFCWDENFVDRFIFSVVGATARGEILLSTDSTPGQFYVFYINPERNTVQRVEIQGFHSRGRIEHRRVQVFVDHVEDLKFITTKTTFAATPLSPLEKKQGGPTFESINKFDSLCLLDGDGFT